MPQAVSKKQWRMMQAVLHSKGHSKYSGGRGTPPKEIAEKYTAPGSGAPDQHGENRGGSWTHAHHAKHQKKESKKHGGKETGKGKGHRDAAAHHHKEHRKFLKKSFEDFYKTHDMAAKDFAGKDKAAATIVIDHNGRLLLGEHKGGLSFPGGHMDPEDQGDFAMTALRELKEEAGIVGRNPTKVWEGKDRGNYVIVYIIESWTGIPKGGDDLGKLHWVHIEDIDWKKLRGCCRLPLKTYLEQKFGKSLQGMVALEKLEKNIIRQRGDHVLEVTHGDALKIVGNGLFRKIREEVKPMQDEDFKDFTIDTHKISIRKHMNDTYSGRVTDGHKMVYQFTNKSLPEVTVALMSVFEWYLPEDEKDLELLDEAKLGDDVIQGGINTLMDNYKRHNIGNIYEEMEHIRENIRNGNAVDLQQVEARMMGLFDKLETLVHNVAGQHDKLADMSGKDIDELEAKLKALQDKIEEMGRGKSETVEAYSQKRMDPERIHDENYPYLPRPQVQISPNGQIKITFNSDWTDLEKENFLGDMRARVIKRSKADD
jgi:8-oxo-dGTP pyrophosphatase MutT (NUDIX family)/Txe/YoeB family toxin of Txe-Axe toxin-antitoxin module